MVHLTVFAKLINKVVEKLSPEEQLIRSTVLDFEELTLTILHTMEYWDRRNCTLTKPLPTSFATKKSKKGSNAAMKKDGKKSPSKKTSSTNVASEVKLSTPVVEDESRKTEIGRRSFILVDCCM